MTMHATTQRELTDRGPVPRIGSPGFVGRERELGELAHAVASGPSVVLVEGETGLGKTRLVQEFLASRGDGRDQVLVAACPAFRQPLTLGPVVDALRQAAPGVARLRLSPLAGALRPLFPEWAGGLPPAPEPLEDAAAARHRLFSALAELLDRLGIAVLVLDDVHWAGEATVEFLLFLACRQPPRMSLVLTCRPEDVSASPTRPRLSRLASGADGRRLALQPLDIGQTAAVMSSMLGGEPVSEEFAAFVHARTEGVPLAVEESVRLMGERADLARRFGRWLRRDVEEIDVPPTVRDSVLERAGRLGGDGRAVLRAGAVLAEPAAEAIVAAVAGLPREQVRAGVCEGLSCGLLAEKVLPNGQGLISFRHTLASRAVYESVPGPRRRELHLRAGQALEHEVPLPLSRLARHFREVGEIGRWCRYAEQAAGTALAAGDVATADDLLYDLITRARLPVPDMIRLTRKMRFATTPDSARYHHVVDALRAVLDTTDLEPGVAAEARFQLGQVLLMMQDYSAGRTEVERAVPGLGHDPALAARAMTILGTPHATDCHASVHLRWLRRAAAVAGSLPPAERSHLAVSRVSALLMLGEEEGWIEAARIPEETQDAQERIQVTRAHLNIGEEALKWGRYGEARERFAAAMRLAEVYQYTQYRDSAVGDLVRLDWLTGAWDGLADRAGSLAIGDGGRPVDLLDLVLVAGLLHAAAGAREQAESCLRQVLDEARRQGAVDYTIDPAAALGRLQLADGRAAEALEVTDEPVALIARKGVWLSATDVAPVRVRALAAAGRAGEAAELVAAFSAGMDGRDAAAPMASLATCRAILAETRGQRAGAAALFAGAAAAWQGLPRPYDALLAREEQARCLLAAGQPDNALAILSELRQELIALGALGDADRVVRTLREHGVAAKRPQRGGWKPYGDQLSPREAEIVKLVAQGQSDRQIAAALFLSPKTVAKHLGSARRKLKAPSRTALVAAALTAGLTADRPLRPLDDLPVVPVKK